VQQAVAQKGKRNIQELDVFHQVHTQASLDFLRYDFPKRPISSDKASKSGQKHTGKTDKNGSSEPPAGAQVITAFFGANQSINAKASSDGPAKEGDENVENGKVDESAARPVSMAEG
jgi:hypothetical protein